MSRLIGNNAIFVQYQQELFTTQAAPGSDPTPILTAMLALQGKINREGSTHVILDVTPAAAMLGALSADWGVERTVMKDKASILPLVIIAKAQVDWQKVNR